MTQDKMKPPERKNDLYWIGQNNDVTDKNIGWNKSNDAWHKWIDEAPVGKVLNDPQYWCPSKKEQYRRQEKAIRDLLKGQGDKK